MAQIEWSKITLMRPTLVNHVEAAIIDYETKLVWNRRHKRASPGIEKRLVRAREILQLLLGPGGDTFARCNRRARRGVV